MEKPNTGDRRLDDSLKDLQHALDESPWLSCTQKTCCLIKLYDIVSIAENRKAFP